VQVAGVQLGERHVRWGDGELPMLQCGHRALPFPLGHEQQLDLRLMYGKFNINQSIIVISSILCNWIDFFDFSIFIDFINFFIYFLFFYFLSIFYFFIDF